MPLAALGQTSFRSEPMMKKQRPTPSKNPAVRSDKQARQEAERAEAALDNVRGDRPQNDRAARNESGIGSVGGGRDMTSGRHSGNQ
jgi:hypothetical protein